LKHLLCGSHNVNLGFSDNHGVAIILSREISLVYKIIGPQNFSQF